MPAGRRRVLYLLSTASQSFSKRMSGSAPGTRPQFTLIVGGLAAPGSSPLITSRHHADNIPAMAEWRHPPVDAPGSATTRLVAHPGHDRRGDDQAALAV